MTARSIVSITYRKGREVPHHWYRPVPNGPNHKLGKPLTFGADVTYTFEGDQRVVRPNGPCEYVILVDGWHDTNLVFDPPLFIDGKPADP